MTKAEKYESLIPQIRSVLAGETDMIANMANVAAILHEEFDFWWTGFYRVEQGTLVLGPFQGPVACTRIAKGRGVCGTAWQRQETVVVEDVEKFKGHIACSSESRSEIVVPMLKSGEVIGMLDIDSRELSCFDLTDQLYLEQIVELLCSADMSENDI